MKHFLEWPIRSLDVASVAFFATGLAACRACVCVCGVQTVRVHVYVGLCEQNATANSTGRSVFLAVLLSTRLLSLSSDRLIDYAASSNLYLIYLYNHFIRPITTLQSYSIQIYYSHSLLQSISPLLRLPVAFFVCFSTTKHT